MLVDLYPRVHRRYSSLAIIGPILDGYGTWLLKQGYSTERAREHFQAAPRPRPRSTATRRPGPDEPDAGAIGGPVLPTIRRRIPIWRSWCGSLWRGIGGVRELALYPPPALTRIEQRVAASRTYLQQVRSGGSRLRL